jgi:hypothetical protein
VTQALLDPTWMLLHVRSDSQVNRIGLGHSAAATANSCRRSGTDRARRVVSPVRAVVLSMSGRAMRTTSSWSARSEDVRARTRPSLKMPAAVQGERGSSRSISWRMR